MKKAQVFTWIQFYSFLFILFSCSGCISTYHKYEKTPCSALGDDPQQDIRKIIISMGFKEKDLVMTNESVQYTKKKKLVFLEISKVIVVKKGKRYTLVSVMKDRNKHSFETNDFDLAIKVYSTLECLAGIKPKNYAAPNDKYDRLAKLKTLLDSGAINTDEYEKEKKKLLDEN